MQNLSGYLPRRLDRHLVGSGSQLGGCSTAPSTPACVHLLDQFLGRVERGLAVMSAGLAAAPDMHLRVDDLHAFVLLFRRCWPCWTRRDATRQTGQRTTKRSARVLDRVLLTNDDGIDAPGMAVLEAIAAAIAREVWVVAPEHDQSGESHAISLHHALRVSRARRAALRHHRHAGRLRGDGHLPSDDRWRRRNWCCRA